MKPLVVYYSNTGSNRYLAERCARALRCDIEAIRPRPNLFPFLLLFSLIRASLGVAKLKHDVKEYDRIVLCGPVWMGRLVSPLRDIINKYRKSINKLYFATCCGSSDAAKDDTFGYATVFPQVGRLAGDTCVCCEAFPIGLVLPEDKQEDSDTIMKTRLSDDNFAGRMQERFESFIRKVTGQQDTAKPAQD
jgi:hypothetical protein